MEYIQCIKNSIAINSNSVVEEDTSVRRGWVSESLEAVGSPQNRRCSSFLKNQEANTCVN